MQDEIEATVESAEAAQAREKIASLARILDSSIRLPGGYRVGLDGIVGLIPGIGDFAGLAASSYLVVLASRAGVSRSVQLMMVYNILFEMVIGTIPLLGDIFDFMWKSNERNLALYDAYMLNPERDRNKNRVRAGVPLLLLAVIVFVAGLIAVSVVKFLLRLVSGL